MNITVKQITQKIIVLLMAGIIGLLIANTAVFLHVHQLDDGTIISHAHPYDKSDDTQPFKTHQHSKLDILIIHSLEILFLPLLLVLILVILEKKTAALFDVENSFYLYFFNTVKDRGPPVLYA